ncbi:thioredoxin family protein [Erythrobacter aquimaris]|uniref:Thioredoxin family protein n=1 Tax=Qipengyuania aquimaris TaxID=255984 RepID=A0A6I4TPH8_9SPHN|nr:thioredoxin family protein [Qipengyuania aquimaris]MXO97209.1 thioredoxin family protein [Qipengyuania aquimaris]
MKPVQDSQAARLSPAFKAFALTLGAPLLLISCASVPPLSTADHPEARSFVVSSDASADVGHALDRANSSGKHVLLIMGANWCHDSRALAGWLKTPRFQDLIASEYELVFVNVGMPQTGDGHNLEIAQRFGLDELPGTPNVLVIDGSGALVNPETATTWRNAASRSEDEIYAELARLAS